MGLKIQNIFLSLISYPMKNFDSKQERMHSLENQKLRARYSKNSKNAIFLS